MKITGGTIYALKIPFVEAFAHSLKDRRFSDSFVVRLTADDGTTGYGEGLARPYVTGETVESGIDFIKKRLFPAVEAANCPQTGTAVDLPDALLAIEDLLPAPAASEKIIPNAARAAMELALADVLLKSRGLSLAAVLRPKQPFVTYSGVITAGAVEKAVQHARSFTLFGIRQLKIKIGRGDDIARVAAVRRSVGPDVSLRVDANGAYDLAEALKTAEELARFDIKAFEQPIAPGDLRASAELKARSAVPVMADESLVTLNDAERLIENSACDFFNLRISKCGGIAGTLRIARLARANNIRLQLGCQVGETAILSAAGRHLAAHLNGFEFVEGSYGSLLLAEDIARSGIHFGYGGRAPVLRGAGLGVEILDDRLEKYSRFVIKLGKEENENARTTEICASASRKI